MRFFEEFLKNTCKNSDYYYSLEEHMAEIFISGDINPVCLIEYDDASDKYIINFRIDIELNTVADLTYRMTVNDTDISISDNFIVHHKSGYVFGQEAKSLYFMGIYSIMNDTIAKQNENIENATYIIKDPIHTFNSKYSYSGKIKKLWLDGEF